MKPLTYLVYVVTHLILSSLFLNANTINVPTEQLTIQAAINFASEGDTVLVAAGTYTGVGNKEIDFLGKELVVLSESGPEHTIIDCEGSGRAFYFHQNESNAAILRGFTITNGSSGGMEINGSSPTIEYCIITGNTANFSGGGILMIRSSSKISHCIIKNNTAFSNGGGIYASSGTSLAIIENCLITGNSLLSTTGQGGGINNSFGTSPLIINCTIANNSAQTGAGVYSSSLLTMRNCIIWHNQSDDAYTSIFSVDHSITYSNVEGGWLGLGNVDSNPFFVNTTVEDYHLQESSPSIDAGNPTDDFSLEPQPNGSRINMGAYGNTPAAALSSEERPIIRSLEPSIGSPDGGTSVTLRGENFGATSASVTYGGNSAAIISWSDTLIITETPAHPSGKVSVVVNNIDGFSDQLNEGFTYTGPATIRVPSDYFTIQRAINFASEGDTVLVAAGTYTGIGNKEIDFLGKELVVLSESGPENTIIDCEGSGRAFFFNRSESNMAILRGFTITNGSSGGMEINGSSPTIEYCIITGNTANSSGGGILMIRSSSKISHCIIKNNTAFNSGAGIYASSGTSLAIIENCLITGNSLLSTTGQGGGINNSFGTSPLMINCTIANNSAQTGAGVYSSSLLTMRNCIIWHNQSDDTYASIFSVDHSITYTNVEGDWLGLGNINVDPLFIDTVEGDYHLQNSSPSIDAGNPTDDLSLEPQPNGSRINMGAYGNTPAAALSSKERPIIRSLEPSIGSPDGGTSVTLRGENFGVTSASVTYGGNSAAIISWSDTLIITETPAHPSGKVSVVVNNIDGFSDQLNEGFTYTGPATIRVPSDYFTIQRAINFASEGDTVLVAAGTYTGIGNKEIDFLGKELVVLSESGPEHTIIDCEGSGRAFYFNRSESNTAILHGFTITNGSSGGMEINGSSPTIEYCIITGNTANSSGGGILMIRSSSKISHCIIKNNTAFNSGAGIYASSGTSLAIIENCLITGNSLLSTTGQGGGINNRFSTSPLIINCTIANNSAQTGAGVYSSSLLTMRNCIIWSDQPDDYCDTGSVNEEIIAEDLDITYSNLSTGVYGQGNISEDPLFLNPEEGIFSLHPNSPCINAGNPQDNFDKEPGANGNRINMGVFGNTVQAAVKSVEAMPIVKKVSSNAGCLEGGEVMTIEGLNFGETPGNILFDDIAVESILNWGETVIQFTLPPSENSGEVDLTLQGSNDQSIVLPSFFSYSAPEVFSVGDTVSGIWSNKCKTTYILTKNVVVPIGESLVIEPGVEVLTAPSTGNDEITFKVDGILHAVGTKEQPIIFSTDSSEETPGVWQGIVLKNRSSVRDECGNDILSRLENCVIEFATIGVTIEDDDVVLESCIVRNNMEDGIYFRGSQREASGVLNNCTILSNGGWGVNCSAFGGGSGSGTSSPLIGGNLISQNQEGGILINSTASTPFSGRTNRSSNASPRIVNNKITENNGYAIDVFASGDWADGIPFDFFYRSYANPEIEGNLIVDNSFSFRARTTPTGGNTWLSFSSSALVNNTFYNNGPIDVVAGDSSVITVLNSQFWDGSGTFVQEDGGQVLVMNTNSDQLATGSGNLSANPLFEDESLRELRLQSNSQMIDAGDNTVVQAKLDLDGHIRIWNGDSDEQAWVDIGAYEFGSPLYTPINVSKPQDSILCEGETLILNIEATGYQISYQWQKNGEPILAGNNSELIVENIANQDAGNYSCLVTDGLGISVQSQPATIHIRPRQEATINIDASTTNICLGDTISFSTSSVNEGDSPIFDWQINESSIGVNEPVFMTDNLNSGDTIRCLLTSSATCTSEIPVISNSLAITVNTLPNPEITANSSLCENEALALTASGGSIFRWIGPAAFSSDTEEAFLPSVTLDNEGEYTVIVTDEKGCSNMASIFVNINALPNAKASSSGPTCEGEQLVLNAEGGASYLWSGPEGFSSTAQEIQLAAISAELGGVFRVEVTDENGCRGLDSVHVDIYPLPLAEATNSSPICEGESLTLNATGGISFQWSGPLGFNSSVQEVQLSGAIFDMSGEYSVLVTDEKGCTNQAQTTVTIDPKLELEVAIIDPISQLCEGESLLLQVETQNAGETPIYEWQINGQSIDNNDAQLLLTNVRDDLRIQSILSSSASCLINSMDTSQVINIEVNPLPEVALILQDSIDLHALPLNLTGGTPAGGVYTDVSGSIIDNFNPALFGAGVHVVTYTYVDENDCLNSATDSITVTNLTNLNSVSKSGLLKIFPNPSQGEIFINSIHWNGQFDLSIFNIQGGLICQFNKMNISKGENRAVNLSSVAKGTYIVRLSSGEFIFHEKIVIQ